MSVNALILSITKDQLASLPRVAYPGTMVVVNTPEEAANALKVISGYPVVGFDTETKPSFQKGRTNPVALIQISVGNCCYLFRIKKCGFIDEFKTFFSDKSVRKIGLSLKDDFKVLHKTFDFEPEGFIDLQDLVKDYNIHDISLQKIYAIIFKERISKNQRLSNWEASELSESQQTYASIDAWACLKIYNHLISGAFCPEDSEYAVDSAADVK